MIVNAVNFHDDHILFFEEKKINKSKLVRDLLDEYPEYIKWKEIKDGGF